MTKSCLRLRPPLLLVGLLIGPVIGPVIGLVVGLVVGAVVAPRDALAGEAALIDGRVVPTAYQSQHVAAGPAARRNVMPHSTVVADARTARQLAAIQGLSYSDTRSSVLLEGASLRVRLYAGKNEIVIGGREYRVKDRIVRDRNELQLTPRVARFLTARIAQYRSAEEQQHKVERRRIAHEPAPLPTLPPMFKPRPIAPKPVPVQVTPAARPYDARSRGAAVAQAGWEPSASERDWHWIILHHSDTETGDLAKYDDYHRNVKHWENGCGYHFVVGNGTLSGDGEVEVGPRWVRQIQGAHAKVPDNRYNERGVGICLVGDFDVATGRPSAAQMDELVNLVRWLKARFGIEDANIHGHCDCCSTCCPGKNFPWAEFRERTAR